MLGGKWKMLLSCHKLLQLKITLFWGSDFNNKMGKEKGLRNTHSLLFSGGHKIIPLPIWLNHFPQNSVVIFSIFCIQVMSNWLDSGVLDNTSILLHIVSIVSVGENIVETIKMISAFFDFHGITMTDNDG